ncbi:serine O-acetyltransferase [Bacterioplanes sanyensis]|uniref:serine O-acetyltransferase n=1 Tax=Bacterioplanes sanyensis TaxID=1249553 RepID=UPI003B3B4C20
MQLLREDIACVFERDPAARNTLEVITTYPGLHAIIHYRLANALWRRGFKWLARFLSAVSRWLTGIEIHPGATIGRRFFIDHGMGVVIGETAEIGDDCTLYHGVTLGGTSWNKGKRHPTLANGVVVGAGAKVLGPIQVADNARIGSNAVVTKDVPEAVTVVGIPGRIVRKASERAEQDDRRAEIARKIGFDAYGMTDEMPDPIARSIHNLMDHMGAVDQKIDTMCQALYNLGDRTCSEALPELAKEDFVSLVDADASEAGAASDKDVADSDTPEKTAEAATAADKQ